MVHYDKVLTAIGEFGAYQKRICVILCLIAIPNSLHITSTVFHYFTPNFRCAVPRLSNDTYIIHSPDHQQLVKGSIPYDKEAGHFSQCQVFKMDDVQSNSSTSSRSNDTRSCNRWVYEKPGTTLSLAMELDYVCDRALYKAHSNMMMLLGMLVGSLFGGRLSDLVGRKKMVFVFSALQNLVACGQAFVWSPEMVMVCRFFVTFTGSCAFLPLVVLLTELVGVSKRSIATMFSMLGFTMGLFVVVLIQYTIGDWRTAQLVSSLPFLGISLFWWVVPESPRWLLSKEKTTEAQVIIKRIARANGTTVPTDMITNDNEKNVKEYDDDDDNGDKIGKSDHADVKIWHLCSRLNIAIRITTLCFSWIVINMVYYGLVLGVGDLIEGNIYVNFTLQSIMELIGNTLCILILEKTGRKMIFCSSMIISGVATLGIALLVLLEAGGDMRWLSVVLFCFGKLGMAVAFSLIFIVTTELLPTKIRNFGLGFCSCAARVSGIVSPYIVSASLLIPGPFGKAFPLLIFGGLSLMSGISAIILPETRNVKLPETFDDH